MIDAIKYSDIILAVDNNMQALLTEVTPLDTVEQDKDIQSSVTRVTRLDAVAPGAEDAMTEINSKVTKHTLIAVLFCNPKTQFCKNEILASLNYLHHRSKEHINIFCCGYGAYWPHEKYPDLEIVTNIDGTDWSYSDNAFVSVVEDFEKRTKWQYSGENELLLIDVFPSVIKDELNINHAIVCNLEKMHKDNAFSSARSLFEDIIRYVASDDAATAWSFSDGKGGTIAKNFLKEIILSFLPKALQENYTKAESFVIKKI